MRAEICVIGLVETADLISACIHLHQPCIGIEVPQMIVIFAQDRAVLVTHPKIQSKISRQPPVILKKQAIGPVMQIQRRIAYFNRRLKWRAGKKVLKRRRIQEASRVVRIGRVTTKKCNAAAGVAISRIRDVIPMKLHAKFQRMFPCKIGNMIVKLNNVVWSLELRPFETTEAGEEVAAESNARQTTSKRATDAGIQSITGSRRI